MWRSFDGKWKVHKLRNAIRQITWQELMVDITKKICGNFFLICHFKPNLYSSCSNRHFKIEGILRYEWKKKEKNANIVTLVKTFKNKIEFIF